jgi:hypothetical protein
MGYGEGFISNGTLMGPDGPIYPNENEVGVTVTDANGRNRYQTKAEAAEIERKTQQYLMDHGNIIDPNKPFNVASTDAGTQSVQAALAKLSQTPGDDKTRQAALQNFLKTTTFTPEQLAAASNGVWGVNDLKTQMAGNPNQPNTRTGYDNPDQAQIYQEQNGPSGGDIRSDAGDTREKRLTDSSSFTKNTSTPEQKSSLDDLVKSIGFNGTDGIPLTNAPMGGLAAMATQTGPQELDPNSIYQNPGTRAQTQEDRDQEKLFDDLRNGKSPTLDPKDLYQNPGDPGIQPIGYGDDGYPPQQPIAYGGDGYPPQEAMPSGGGMYGPGGMFPSREFDPYTPPDGISPYEGEPIKRIKPLLSSAAPIDEYNPNDYFYSGGAKKGGAIHKATGGLTHYTYGKPADVMENLGLRGQQMAQGGLPHMSNVPLVQGRMDFRQGSAVHGEGDGQSDDIPAMLADGEYVIDAETVAQIGNGSTKAGAQALDKFREGIRAHKRSAPINKIPPKTKALTSYLKVK